MNKGRLAQRILEGFFLLWVLSYAGGAIVLRTGKEAQRAQDFHDISIHNRLTECWNNYLKHGGHTTLEHIDEQLCEARVGQ